MKKTIGVGALALLVLAGCTTTSSEPVSLPTKTFKGTWEGGELSTFRILSASQVRYCYAVECTTEPYTGDPNSRFRFSWGTSRFVFTRTDDGYDGSFRAGSATSKVSMR
ncbi:MAG: hypothetical protein AAFY73_12785 [Pseudomonadota bacterium]